MKYQEFFKRFNIDTTKKIDNRIFEGEKKQYK